MMQLASKKSVQFLCKKYGLRPSRSSGQNFLVCQDVVEDSVRAGTIKAHDVIVEVGAGFGTLTAALAAQAGTLYSVEMDKRLFRALQQLEQTYKNLKTIQGDFFQQWPQLKEKLSDIGYKVVANVPYNITSKLIRHFLEQHPRPREMVLLVQREVAERIVATIGAMSLLAVSVQFYSVPKIVRQVSKDCFFPAPRVDSALIHISNIGIDANGYQKQLKKISNDQFFSIVKIGFSAKRKQLHNNLTAGLRLSDQAVKTLLTRAQIKPTVRAQELSIQNWIDLASAIHSE